MPEQQFYNIPLLDKVMVARDIMELRFEKPVGFTFTPGQFVQFHVPHGEGFVLRNYSISSHPDEDTLEFCAKIISDGKASTFFLQLIPDNQARISSAKGVFICRPEHSVDKMFIATGAGIAPIMSMIKDQLKKLTPQSNIRLLFGIRMVDDIFWVDRFQNFAAQHPQFSFYFSLSRPPDAWTGRSGRVTAHLEELMLHGTDYYICGSVEMVKDVRAMLMAEVVGVRNIHVEIF